MAQTITKAQTKAALDVVFAVTETIREARHIHEGTLYAVLMSKMDYQTFTSLIRTILNTGLVIREAGHVLQWVGPEIPTSAEVHLTATDRLREAK